MIRLQPSPPAIEPATTDGFDDRIAFFESLLTEWLASDDVTIACGSWTDGGIAELLPRGRGRLLPAAYEGCFAGVRELRIEGAEHHLHVDLGRVHRAVYAIAPSVCFAGRPSFEVRLLVTGPGGAESSRWSVSAMLTQPHRDGRIDRAAFDRYLARARRHAAERPALVRIELANELARSKVADDVRLALADAYGLATTTSWDELARAVEPAPAPAPALSEPLEPWVRPVLEDALELSEASLVIYRDKTLVEFQTDGIGGVFRYVEDGHVSWQIGRFEEHHCHLALSAVTSVRFSAEPVPCQGGRWNYTVWFEVPGDCGNPYRPNAYFSIVLNRPYANGVARLECIEPMFALYRRHRHLPCVTADARFLRALEVGPDLADADEGAPCLG